MARDLALRLIAHSSGPSPCAGERRCALDLARWAREVRLPGARGTRAFNVELRPLPGDPHRRCNVGITLPGRGPLGVLLLGHLDTVGTHDFGPLESIALNPGALKRRRPCGRAWLQGRGALDMKSGIAAGAEALLGLAEIPESERGGAVTLVVTCDEENASAGMHALRGWPAVALGRRVLAISTDFVPPPPRGRAGRLCFGSVGKCLAGVVLRTSAAHAAEAGRHVDAAAWGAEVVRRFGARSGAGGMPPARALRARDLKPGYDTQLPQAFVAYFNVLGYPLEPRRVLADLAADVRRAWKGLAGTQLRSGQVQIWKGKVIPDGAGRAPWDSAQEVVISAGGPVPGATVYFAPPYYAARSGKPAALAMGALRRVAGKHRLAVSEPYPYISDVSLLGPATGAASSEWARACPIQSRASGLGLRIPFVTLGPWGRGAHGPDEAVRADYAFDTLPGILEACVRELWRA